MPEQSGVAEIIREQRVYIKLIRDFDRFSKFTMSSMKEIKKRKGGTKYEKE